MVNLAIQGKLKAVYSVVAILMIDIEYKTFFSGTSGGTA